MKKTKETIREVKIKDIEHSFYCDECGKYLGTVTECDDGWYQELGEFSLEIYIDDWYCLKTHLCDDCRYGFLENLKTALGTLGFNKE